jgi:hypothetical protein
VSKAEKVEVLTTEGTEIKKLIAQSCSTDLADQKKCLSTDYAD